MKKFLILCLLSAFLLSTNGLYFFLKEGSEKCLFDDIAKNQVIVGHYNLMDKIPQSAGKEEGVTVKVTNPSGEIAFTKLIKDKGKFSFTSTIGGSYKFCFLTTTSHWIKENKSLRFSIRLIVGEGDINYEDLAKKEHLNGLQIRSKKMLDKSKQFIKLQELNRQNEDVLFEENEKVNERVILATVFQTIIILASGIFQILNLRKFFIQKKLF